MVFLRTLFSGTRPLVALSAVLALAACATPHYERAAPNPHYKVGKPYKINGQWYRPALDPDYDEVGVASWYGSQFHGRKTANGEIFDMNLLSAAHTTLPMPSMAVVENLENGRQVTVRINDRGPFASNRLIDLSREAARQLGFEKQGLARVRVRYLGPAPLRAQAPASPGDASRYAAYAARQHPVKYAGYRPPAAARATPPPQQQTQAPKTETEAAQPTAPARLIRASFEVDAPQEAAIAPQPVSAPSPAAGDVNNADKLYVIRVAALSSLDNLGELEAEMKPIGPLRLSRIENTENKTLYRITMGPFRSAGDAAAPLEAVRRAGYADAVIVAITP